MDKAPFVVHTALMNGRSVKERMQQLRIPEAELARRMGVDPSTISKFLSEKTNPGRPFRDSLARHLGDIEREMKNALSKPPPEAA